MVLLRVADGIESNAVGLFNTTLLKLELLSIIAELLTVNVPLIVIFLLITEELLAKFASPLIKVLLILKLVVLDNSIFFTVESETNIFAYSLQFETVNFPPTLI